MSAVDMNTADIRPADVSADDDWARRASPSIADIERLADHAYRSLPPQVRGMCEGLAIHVVDWPDDDTLDDLGCDGAYDLLGLFRGVGLAQGGGAGLLQTGQLPNQVWLYRRPLLDHWAEYDDTLGQLVAHVLIHEIGHHVGLSDDDMLRLEAGADQGGD